MDDINQKLYRILQKHINQSDYSVFLTEACEQYLLTKNTAYLQLIETFLLKYSTVDRFVIYCYIFRNTNNKLAGRLLNEHLPVLKLVLEEILSRNSFDFCKNSNGNILFMYLFYFFGDDKAKIFLSKGAHTLKEYNHRFLFGKISEDGHKVQFLNMFLKNFEKNNYDVDSILILFALYLDSVSLVKEKLYPILFRKLTYLQSISTTSHYEFEVISMMLNQLGVNIPSEDDSRKIAIPKGMKKKVAILISGQMRVLTESVINFCKELKKDSQLDVNIFVATWEDQGRSIFRHVEMRGIDELGKIAITESFKQYYIADNLFEQIYMPNMINDLDKEYLYNKIAYDEIDVASNIVSQQLSTNQERMYHRIKKAYELSQSKGKYDVYIRIRPDLIFEYSFSSVEIIKEMQQNEIYVKNIAFLDNQGIRIDDNLAIASSRAMETYANTLDLVPFMKGANSHSAEPIIAHRSLAYLLLANNINIFNTLNFSQWKFDSPKVTVSVQQLLDHALSIPQEKRIKGFHDIYVRELQKQLMK